MAGSFIVRKPYLLSQPGVALAGILDRVVLPPSPSPSPSPPPPPVCSPAALDFEVIGIAAPSTGTTVGSFFAASGVTFSANALASHNGQATGNVVPPPTRSGKFGFIRNAVNGSGVAGDFTIQFAAGTTWRSISLEWAAVDQFQVTVFDGLGGYVSTSGLNGLNWSRGWSALDLTDVFGGRIDSIGFSGFNKRFAIDKLVFGC